MSAIGSSRFRSVSCGLPTAKLYLEMTQEQLATAPEFSAAGDATLPATRSSERGTPGQGSVAPPPSAEPDARALAEAQQEAREVFAEDDPRVVSGIADNKEAFDGDEPARGHSGHDQSADDQAVENEPHEGGDNVPHEP